MRVFVPVVWTKGCRHARVFAPVHPVDMIIFIFSIFVECATLPNACRKLAVFETSKLTEERSHGDATTI